MGVVKQWRQRQLVAAVSGELASNMDKACQFVVEQAKAKAPKRTGLLQSQIDYRVEAKGLTITGYIGAKKKAFYGYFLELGTSKMAARPFLRPAVYQNGKRITRILAGKG